MANTRRLTASMPDDVQALLATLGGNLRLARRRRRLTIAALAEKLMVSSPTVRKLEQGDPTVSLGVLITALWVLGLGDGVRSLAAPETDSAGLHAELQRLARAGRRKDDDEFGF